MVVLRGIEKGHTDLKNATKLPYLGYTHTHTHFNGISRPPRTQRGRGEAPAERGVPLCGFSCWGLRALRRSPVAWAAPQVSPRLLFLPGRSEGAFSQRLSAQTPARRRPQAVGEAALGPASPRARQLTGHALALTGSPGAPDLPPSDGLPERASPLSHRSSRKDSAVQLAVRFNSVAQSCRALRPHAPQHARPPCPGEEDVASESGICLEPLGPL